MRDPAPLPDDLSGRPFDRAAARRAGLTPGRVRRRDITRPFHGIQAVRPIGTLRERAEAYLLRLKPRQAFSHQTSLLLQGLPLPRAFEEETDLHVAAALPAPVPTTRNVVGHRVRIVPPVVVHGRLPVVRVDEAWAQMAPLLTLDELIELGDAILWGDPAWLPLLQAAAVVPHRPSGARLRKALVEMRCDCRSPGETRIRLLAVRDGLPEPELNAEVVLPNGEVVHPDLVWRKQRVLLEYESGGHLDEQQRRYDLGRYAREADAGWVVLTVSADDLVGDAARSLLARLRRALGL